MSEFTKQKYFIGIDISKDHLDVALLKADEGEVFKDKIGHTPNIPLTFSELYVGLEVQVFNK